MNLRTTAEEILTLTGRTPLHSDPKVEQQILIQDIADLIERSGFVLDLRREINCLESENRQLEREVDALEDELEYLEAE